MQIWIIHLRNMETTINRYQHVLGSMPFMFFIIFFSCGGSDNYIHPVSNDTTKPEMVTNVEVDNFNGGAHIVYQLPESENILYVQAEYNIRTDKSRQTKSSYYSDTITVKGFEKSAPYDVTLYTVSRADVKSDPVVITVT